MRRRGLLLAIVLTYVAAPPAFAQRIKLPKKLEELEKAARVDSNDAAAHFNVALAYWNEKRFDDAERALHEAITIDPRFADPHLALGVLPFGRRPELWREIPRNEVPEEWQPIVENADRMYRRAFLLDPMVDLRLLGAAVPSGLWFPIFREFLEGRYENAHEGYHRVLEEFERGTAPDQIPISLFWFHGLSAAHIGEYDEAIWDLERLLSRSISDEKTDSLVHVPLRTNEYRYLLATLKQTAGRTSQALRLYREVLAYDLGQYMAHVRIADIFEQRGLWRPAIEERRRATELNPDDATVWLELGVTLAKAGRWAEAEAALQRAMETNPRDARCAYFLGVVQTESGKVEEARVSFQRFLELAPSRYEPQIVDAKKRLATLE